MEFNSQTLATAAAWELLEAGAFTSLWVIQTRRSTFHHGALYEIATEKPADRSVIIHSIHR